MPDNGGRELLGLTMTHPLPVQRYQFYCKLESGTYSGTHLTNASFTSISFCVALEFIQFNISCSHSAGTARA